MKLQTANVWRRHDGFTMVDAIFAMAISGIMFVALYSGLGAGFTMIKLARENARATQIMVQQTEILRLLTWNQVTNTTPPRFIPTNIILIPYYSVDGVDSGLKYTSRITVATCPVGGVYDVGSSYADSMRKVTIRLDWGQLGKTNRTRTMSTYVTRNGLQNYVY